MRKDEMYVVGTGVRATALVLGLLALSVIPIGIVQRDIEVLYGLAVGGILLYVGITGRSPIDRRHDGATSGDS